MWRDNKVRSLYTAASASNIMGVPSLAHEDAVPFLTSVATRLLGGRSAGESEARATALPLFAARHGARRFSVRDICPGVLEFKLRRRRAYFKDRVVLVGATAERLTRFLSHSLGEAFRARNQPPRARRHAAGKLAQPGGPTVHRSCAILLAALAAVALTFFFRSSAKSLVVGLVGGAILWLSLCAAVLWLFSYFLPAAAPLLTWLVCGFAGVACEVSIERRERSRMRATLERYVSKDVVREIADNPDSYLQSLGGQRKEMVVLFSDLKGFTSDSERLDPADMVMLLNEYFRDMVGVVFEYSGHTRQIHWGRAHGDVGRPSPGESRGRRTKRSHGRAQNERAPGRHQRTARRARHPAVGLRHRY